MLPIVHRELRSTARSPKLYRWRLRVAVVEIVVAAILVVTSRPGTASGGRFFWFLASCAFLFCLFEGLRKTADSISEEKREGTLGLLFLTDLNGFDIILGKLSGAMVRSINGLLAFIPILAITLLLGGTTGGELARVALVLINTLWISLTLCLFISTVSRERSLAGGIVLLAALTILPALANAFNTNLASLSPAWLLYGSSDAMYAMASGSFWLGMTLLHLLGWLAIAIASWIVPRCWQDKGKRIKITARALPATPDSWRQRAKLLDINPIFWLAYSPRQHRQFNFIFLGVLALMVAAAAASYFFTGDAQVALIIGMILLTLVLYLFLASQASSNLAESKRNGAMELLLSTPLRVDSILSGHWQALRKMFLPALIVAASLQAGVWIAATFFDEPGPMLFMTKMLAETILAFITIGWVGMWMGLSSKTPNRAFLKTILLGLIAPFFIPCVPAIIVQIILIFVAKDKVKWDFRRFIAEKYLQQPAFVLSPIAPPPIPK